ncbi:epoxyqueuosine reductase QueH [Christensenella minuta]|uniref:epoxyqueuosine reductase QueH n=1 Tax=Christensenella minuta TaxID=626937 RepID=UPI0021589F56|nr:epoxyqueuosine reductase QueH [Christensenella minuta]
MMNAQIVLEKTISLIQEAGLRPSLLLHACCAPCASYVLEYLSPYFDISIFYFNPNIYPPQEYSRRLEELRRMLKDMDSTAVLIEGAYEPHIFSKIAHGHESDAERGPRCSLCYALRLEETAKQAAKDGFDYFATTLSISPHKDAAKLNELGLALSAKYEVDYLVSDFKKKNGYLRSLELSRQYGLYRQEYCGCMHSMRPQG